MNYELGSTKIIGTPKVVVIDEVEVLVIPTGLFTKVVGQTHKGFENFDKVEVPILKTDGEDKRKVKQDAFAKEFIKTKYPNT